MPPTIQDFKARLDAKKAEQAKLTLVRQDSLKQAAVKADLLMQHEGWDFFLTAMQAQLETDGNLQVEWMKQAAERIDPIQQREAQLNYAIHRSRVELLEAIIAWPSQWKSQQKQPQG